MIQMANQNIPTILVGSYVEKNYFTAVSNILIELLIFLKVKNAIPCNFHIAPCSFFLSRK